MFFFRYNLRVAHRTHLSTLYTEPYHNTPSHHTSYTHYLYIYIILYRVYIYLYVSYFSHYINIYSGLLYSARHEPPPAPHPHTHGASCVGCVHAHSTFNRWGKEWVCRIIGLWYSFEGVLWVKGYFLYLVFDGYLALLHCTLSLFTV